MQLKISSQTLFHTKQFFLMTEIHLGSITKLKRKLLRKILTTNPIIFKTIFKADTSLAAIETSKHPNRHLPAQS